jgi:hypothetical protein
LIRGTPFIFAVSKNEGREEDWIVEDGEVRAVIAERLFLRIFPFFFAQWPDCGILKK